MKQAHAAATKSLTYNTVKLSIALLWPSFLVAGIFTGIFFAFVDPLILLQELGVDSELRLAGYSITFLVTWVACTLTAMMSFYTLSTPTHQAPSLQSHSPEEPHGDER